jgi:hypothetical protein
MDRPLPEEDQEEAIYILNLVGLCKQFNTLPQPGGLLEQDSLFTYLALVIDAAYGERLELDQSRSKASGSQHPRGFPTS